MISHELAQRGNGMVARHGEANKPNVTWNVLLGQVFQYIVQFGQRLAPLDV